jgi:hypothetical protein
MCFPVRSSCHILKALVIPHLYIKKFVTALNLQEEYLIKTILSFSRLYNNLNSAAAQWVWLGDVLYERGIDVHCKGNRLVSTAFKPTPKAWPAHPPIQWVPCELLVWGVKRPRREVNHSPPFSTQIQNISYILNSHTCLHGVTRENSHFSKSASLQYDT